MRDPRTKGDGKGEWLLELHRRHLGVYKKVAASLSVNPSAVSLVANGIKRSDRIMAALLTELREIDKMYK